MRRILEPRLSRIAFTTVELLIVIGIIVVLVSLSAVAVVRFSNTGPTMATTTNLNKMMSALDAQWKAVREKASRDRIPPEFLTAVGGGNAANPQMREKFVQERLKQAFPMSFAEVLTSASQPKAGVAVWPAYTTHLSGVTASTGTNEEQQAICLLMALTQGPNAGVTADALRSGGAVIRFSNAGSLDGCADAWEQPLLFSRQTVDNPTLAVQSDSTKANYNPLKWIPVILSKGPDRQAGVDSNLVVSNLSQAQDNLYTRSDWDKYLKP